MGNVISGQHLDRPSEDWSRKADMKVVKLRQQKSEPHYKKVLQKSRLNADSRLEEIVGNDVSLQEEEGADLRMSAEEVT
jgi:hypothetical protein